MAENEEQRLQVHVLRVSGHSLRQKLLNVVVVLEPLQSIDLFLVFGTLLYNEIIVLPVMGFDENTKEKIAAREGGDGEKIHNANYYGLSPGKGHEGDARNKRALQAHT